jgi:hypothetical protein
MLFLGPKDKFAPVTESAIGGNAQSDLEGIL